MASAELEAIRKLSELVTEQHKESTERDKILDGHVRALWKRVDGREPRSGPDGALLPLPKKDPRAESESIPPIPIEEHVSGHDLGLAAIDGRLIVVESTLKSVNSHVTKTHDMQTAQTKAMGIGLSFFKYLGSKEGLRAVATVIAALAGLLAAVNTTYANYKKFNAVTTTQQTQTTTRIP